MKVCLDVASTHAFILHVDYYILACCFFFFFFFFFEKFLVVCFNKDGDSVLVLKRVKLGMTDPFK